MNLLIDRYRFKTDKFSDPNFCVHILKNFARLSLDKRPVQESG